MEPVGLGRKLALMPAGRGNGGAGLLRSVGAVRSANSILGNLKIRHTVVADGCGEKCGKTHTFPVCVRAG